MRILLYYNILSRLLQGKFAETEKLFRETEGVDVYADGFGHSVVLGADDTHVYTMVQATDVPWDGVPEPSETQYKQIQYQMLKR